METTLRLAIIGCGVAGNRHAWACLEAGIEVRWAVDTNSERARALPAAHWTTDRRQALDDPEVDAVSICLPHALHGQVAVEAAQAGKHVLCEKPMAASLEEADRMIEAARRAGAVLMIAENARYDPLHHRLRDLLDEGAIGQPALLQTTRECYLTRSFTEDRTWLLDQRAAAGGIMMSGGIHDFETLRMLVGEVESVYALRARQRFAEMEGDDTSVALVRFRNGAVGTLVESFVSKSLATASGAEAHTLRIDGDLGSLCVRDGQTIHLFSEREEYLPSGSLSQHDIHVAPADTVVLELQHFARCIQTGEEPITSGRSQRRPLELVLAAYRSMESGAPVRV